MGGHDSNYSHHFRWYGRIATSSFFKAQRSVIEHMQEDISKNNSGAADWRTKVLLAQQEINVCEINMPQVNEESLRQERLCIQPRRADVAYSTTSQQRRRADVAYSTSFQQRRRADVAYSTMSQQRMRADVAY
jgi:hypothetical protein